jgi:KipI family sensor histidine kinase inhibitor
VKVIEFGDRAVLISELGQFSLINLIGYLREAFPDFQVRNGMETVLVESAYPSLDLLVRVSNSLKGFPLQQVFDSSVVVSSQKQNELRVPVRYDGEDLLHVSQILKINTSDLISLHNQALWRVAFIGFAPGFPYLMPYGPEALVSMFQNIPRLQTPRPKVPKGSVALAAGMSAIYPQSTPGGWQLIGRTELELFDQTSSDPARFKTGDLIRFVAIN